MYEILLKQFFLDQLGRASISKPIVGLLSFGNIIIQLKVPDIFIFNIVVYMYKALALWQ
jgi:hypothetical protein